VILLTNYFVTIHSPHGQTDRQTGRRRLMTIAKLALQLQLFAKGHKNAKNELRVCGLLPMRRQARETNDYADTRPSSTAFLIYTLFYKKEPILAAMQTGINTL